VWAYVSAVEHMGEWVEGVSDVRCDEEVGVGTRFSSKYSYRGKTFDVEYEVTAYDPPVQLDITSREGPFPFDGSIRLVESGGRTEVSNTIDAGSDSFATTVIFTLFGPVVRRLMRRQLAGELHELAGALEEAGPAVEATA
jgi:hypothetical protein